MGNSSQNAPRRKLTGISGSNIYSLWEAASVSAGVCLVLILPAAAFSGQKALKSPGNPARAAVQR